MSLIEELLLKLHDARRDKKMEERMKLLEGKVDLAMQTLAKMDQALGVMFQHLAIEKAFFDGLTINKPVNQEEKK